MRRVFGVCSDGWLLCGQNGSPNGSVMSCQSLAARAFAENDKEMTHCTTFHRSVRFSSESRGSGRASNDQEIKKESSGSISLTALAVTPVTSQCSAMSQSVPSNSLNFDLDIEPGDQQTCRFPKLEECAHFHYERVALGGLSIEVAPCEGDATDCAEEGWICLRVRSHVVEGGGDAGAEATLLGSWSEGDVREWTLARSPEHLRRLDEILHRCIYDRKVSGLPNLSTDDVTNMAEEEYKRLISDYMHHLSIIADDSINCGPALNWLQMDNKGHKLLVANEDSSSINTPAVAAAYSVRKYVSQARDEISFDVGDMISIIDMPGPNESRWWRGKRGFRVGFFPHHCVAVIGDKVPRNMTQPPPIVGSVAVAPIKPVLRKHGKLISLFRSFILSRPSRRSLKQQGILRERVFGCDLGEHLLNCGHDVPLVLVECAGAIECRGAVDGVYRLSGGSGLTQRLRSAFDSGHAPDLKDAPDIARDPHAVPSLLKMYFRELPNPLCTYQLYESFVSAVQLPEEAGKLRAVRQTVVKLPPPHYRTLAYLMRHLRRVSLLGGSTGMTPRNMAIVWAPNLLRAPRHHHALQGVAVQAVVTEFLICYAEELFAQEQGADSEPESLEQEQIESQVELRGMESGRRPKSLPVNPPTKLLSLEEARRRGLAGGAPASPPAQLPPPSGAIAAAAAVQLRPASHLKPKYIEVGSGPNNLPQYHTVLDLPLSGTKRGLKRSPSGWRGLFTRSHKQQRPRSSRAAPIAITPPIPLPPEDISMGAPGLRPVKSCESLTSDTDTLAPLAERASVPLKHHTRSSSCDSYFEPWQAELADMRLRLSPQERDHHMFSEEDDTQPHAPHQGDSLCSSPAESGLCSVDPSPRRNLRVDIEAANELAEKRRAALEEQLSQIGYIDGESPRARPRPPPEKRHSARPSSPRNTDVAKRLCKDRDSPKASLSDFQTSLGNVKLRERGSPRKSKTTSRYSGLHHPIEPNEKIYSRLSWHGKDGHSTLIKIDWPIENSVSNLTTSTINSSPITPITPIYDPLETDSDVSGSNKHTIKIGDCLNCNEGTCLKCELKATDYTTDSLEPSPIHSDVSYKNLNRLSAVSTSSSEDKNLKVMTSSHESESLKVMTSSHESYKAMTSSHESEAMKGMTSSHESLKAMTSSHESSKLMTSSHESSSFSNASNHDYECCNFTRPNYINLQSSSSSPGSPLKSPLKSTISITFRTPTKSKDSDRDSVYEDIDLDKNLSIVEDATVPQTDASLPTQQAYQPDFNQDLIILETPTETHLDDDDVDVYSQVKFFKKSIEEVNAMVFESPDKENDVLEESVFIPEESHYVPEKSNQYVLENNHYTPDESNHYVLEEANHFTPEKCNYMPEESNHYVLDESNDYISKESKKPNHYALESNHYTPEKSNYMPKELNHYMPEESNHYITEESKNHYENVQFKSNDYENINVETLKICDNLRIEEKIHPTELNLDEFNNGNIIKKVEAKNLNVRELAIRFESPTEQKGPFIFEKFKAEVKYPSLERKDDRVRVSVKIDPKPISPKSYKLSKNSARSLDEDAFVKEFGTEKDRRKSFEVRDIKKPTKLPDLNLNIENAGKSITPTSENKISLIQRFNEKRPEDIKTIIGFETEKKLSRERIEKYKEERRNFLREKYSSQSFRSNPEQLTRIKMKKELKEVELPKFERRNTVDLGQRMRFSLAKSANNLDTIQSPTGERDGEYSEREFKSEREGDSLRRDYGERKDKMSPTLNIKDMAAMFEQKQNPTG